MSLPLVVLSVVSGARPELIDDFLRSVYSTTDTVTLDLRVVAILNRPAPGHAERLRADAGRAGWAARVEVRENATPLGFAANHNSVMRDVEADHYLIANDDVIVRDGAISTLVRFIADADQHVAVASPQLLDPDGSVQASTYSFPTVWRMLLSVSGLRDAKWAARAIAAAGRTLPRFGAGRSRYWAHDRTTIVDSVRGAFVLVRAEAVRDVGPMDEVALVGAEETEWHRRMADRGWRVVFVPAAQVVHLEKQTVGASRALEVEFLKGRLNYFFKHTSSATLLFVRAASALLYGIRWLAAGFWDDEGRRVAASAFRVCVTGRS